MDKKIYDELKKIAGENCVFAGEPMKAHTSFRIGGPADFFVTPGSVNDLCSVIEFCVNTGTDYFILGNGSNLLVSDSGYRGVIIQIRKKLCGVRVEGDLVFAQAGALLSRISAAALDASLAGFEFASGIPGTLGGAVVMNAGAYGGEMKDVVLSADIFTPGGKVETLTSEELGFAYRTSAVKDSNCVVLGAVLKLSPGNGDDIEKLMNRLKTERSAKQPLELPSAGSAFKRPPGYFAGKLVMDAGLKGYCVGDASVSEKHCGFLVNKGSASAADMKRLFDDVIRIVKDKSGVILEPEVKFVGEF